VAACRQESSASWRVAPANTTAERLRRKHLELAERGLPATRGGDRPYGFEDDYTTIREDEAVVIREVAERIIAGDTIRGICTDLNRRGVATVTGKPWVPGTLRKMVLSHRIAGQRFHRGVVYDAVWPAIIDPADHRRILAILNDPARDRRRPGAARYLLTGGVVVCGLCGAALVARPKGDGRRQYVCAKPPGFVGCGKIASLSEPIDDLVLEAMFARLNTPLLTDALAGRDDDTDNLAIVELERLDARLAELGEMWAAGDLDAAALRAASKSLEAQKATLEAQVRSTATSALPAALRANEGPLRGRWPDLSIDQQRAIVAAVIDKVVVGPAVKGRNFFDPSRVAIEWRV
jgi:site-specific DNA recombinase